MGNFKRIILIMFFIVGLVFDEKFIVIFININIVDIRLLYR